MQYPEPINEDDESNVGFTESVLSVNSKFHQQEDNMNKQI